MKTAVFVTARSESTRLPGKATREVVPGVELLRYIIRRMAGALVDAIVLCTTERSSDDELVRIAEQEGVHTFRGSCEDKLDRWLGATRAYGIDAFATADGDDPFCSPELINDALRILGDRSDVDFVRAPEGLVCGGFTYALRSRALQRVCEIKGTDDTEMMWPYFEDTGLFKGVDLPVSTSVLDPHLRLTVDYEEDLELARILAAEGQRTGDESLAALVAYARAHPELADINAFRHQEWRENQLRHTHLILRGDDV